MKRIAENACLRCAHSIYEGFDALWQVTDRIERRWRIQGCTQTHIDRWTRQKSEHAKKLSRQHDQQQPDRLTYLHR